MRLLTRCALLTAVALSLAGCGDDQPREPGISTPSSTSSSSTSPSLTDTTAPTTIAPVPTSTTPEDTALLSLETETSEGWRYLVEVRYVGPAPARSPAGCIDLAPPGLTNLEFEIRTTNLLDDRPAPAAVAVISANLIGDGSVLPDVEDVFTDEMIEARTSQEIAEVVPGTDGAPCILNVVVGIGPDIDPGETRTSNVIYGPIEEDLIDEFIGGIRFDDGSRRTFTVPTE